jgi:hypothetical protein
MATPVQTALDEARAALDRVISLVEQAGGDVASLFGSTVAGAGETAHGGVKIAAETAQAIKDKAAKLTQLVSK